MNLQEATKEAAKHKPSGHFMMVEISYDKKLVLPYKAGLALMESLQEAQIIQYGYGTKPDRISQIDSKTILASPMSIQEYQDLVIATLMMVTADEVKKQREEGIKKEMEQRAIQLAQGTA
jgi:hypothetical protein